MTAKRDTFEGLIGQEAVKRKLNFYINAFKSTSRMPFLLFNSGKGMGKTAFARATARSLTNRDGRPRPILELNSASVRNNAMFFEQVFLSYMNGKEITVFFDEAHNLPNDFTQVLLTLCNIEADPVREFEWKGVSHTFDFTKVSFFFATTEADKLFPPLKDRLDLVSFGRYSEDELIQIMKISNDTFTLNDPHLEAIVANTLRGNPRFAVRRSQEIEAICASKKVQRFTEKIWGELCYHLDIKPYGLTSGEIEILRVLNKRGPTTLTGLGQATDMSVSSIRRDIENYLVRCGFMKIEGLRKITPAGSNLLKELDKLNIPTII